MGDWRDSSNHFNLGDCMEVSGIFTLPLLYPRGKIPGTHSIQRFKEGKNHFDLT
jgi:hypothetical protein